MGIKFIEKKGYWEAFTCMRHPVTKKPTSKRKVNLKSEAHANRVEKQLIAALTRKFTQAVYPYWGKFLLEFFDDLNNRDISKKTVENMKMCLIAHTKEVWGSKLINEISTYEIRELLRSKEDLSESHRKNILKYIRGAFNFAVEKKIIPTNPTPNMKFKVGMKLNTVLTREQCSILLNHTKIMNHQWYPIYAMALYTGLRNGELYALTWDKIDLDNRKALIDSSWNSKDGFKDTKSGDDRVIELAPELIYILKELKLKSADTAFVLPRIDTWDKGEQARELRRVLEGLGLPRVRFHDLRASWATMMLSNGIEPIKVMSMGGWKDLKTMQFYIRKAGVDIKGISDKLSLHNPKNENNVIFLNSTMK